jgi:hypothetical protein
VTKPNPVDIDQLRALLNSNNTIDDICKMLRITRSRLRTIIQEYKLPRKKYPTLLRKKSDKFHAEPTPEELVEIETRKKEVQARWSEKETAVRFTGPKRQTWSIPSYNFDSRSVSFTEDNP